MALGHDFADVPVKLPSHGIEPWLCWFDSQAVLTWLFLSHGFRTMAHKPAGHTLCARVRWEKVYTYDIYILIIIIYIYVIIYIMLEYKHYDMILLHIVYISHNPHPKLFNQLFWPNGFLGRGEISNRLSYSHLAFCILIPGAFAQSEGR